MVDENLYVIAVFLHCAASPCTDEPARVIASLADYASTRLPWLAARPALLALLIAVGPILLALSWQEAQKKIRALTTKEQTRVSSAIAREDAKGSLGEPGKPPPG